MMQLFLLAMVVQKLITATSGLPWNKRQGLRTWDAEAATKDFPATRWNVLC